jgi:hypothetical protein
MYADAKSSCAEHLYGSGPISKEDYNKVRARYDMASEIGFHIPDNRFSRLKQKHVQKGCISRDLDTRPFMSIRWSIVKFWWRDNFGEKALTAKMNQGNINRTNNE